MEKTINKDLFSRIEPVVFLAAVCANLIPLFLRKFFPFMDAPAHIYNADLLNQLLVDKSTFVAEYLEINKVIVPNWFSELLMFPFLNYFEPDVVEKIYLVVYFAGLPLALRYCINCIAPKQRHFAFLAVPLTYNTLSLISFYNFSSGLVFLLLIMGYFYRHFAYGTPRALNYFMLFVLCVLAYFCHLVVFVIAMLYVAMIYGEAQYLKHGWRIRKWFGVELLYIGISILPAFALLCVYSVKKHAGTATYEFLDNKTLLDFFLGARPYLSFGGAESATAGILGWTILASVILGLYLQLAGYVKMPGANKFFPWAGLLALLILYIFLPNSDGVGGFVTVRLCLIFFLVSMVYIATVELRRGYAVIIILITLVTHAFRVTEYGLTIEDRNKQVAYIRDQAAFIEPNSFLYCYRANDDWLSGHFHSYVCLGQPGAIALQNYECNVGYFPLTWKDPIKISNVMGQLESFTDLDKAKETLNNRPIYMWVYGDLASRSEEAYVNLKRNIEKNCVLLNTNPFASLYRLK